jgi:prepilin-type N-terminal cleavage/methylation domain-containing protein
LRKFKIKIKFTTSIFIGSIASAGQKYKIIIMSIRHNVLKVHNHVLNTHKKVVQKFEEWGFTLIELLITIAIVGVVSAAILILINPKEQSDKAKDSVKKSHISIIGDALSRYALFNGVYPAPSQVESLLASSGELTSFPTNPSDETYSCVSTSGQGATLVNGYCYNATGTQPYGAVVYAPLEANANSAGCDSPCVPWQIWSALAAKSGTHVSETEPPPDISVFESSYSTEPTATPGIPEATNTPTSVPPPPPTLTPTSVPLATSTPTSVPVVPTATPSPTPISGSVPAYVDTVTGIASSGTAVTTSGSVTASANTLYLAAVSSRGNINVNSVTGLGLTWTQIVTQCTSAGSGRVSVWRAYGSPASSSTVTANLAIATTGFNVAVSRFTNVDSVNPIGNVVAANYLGVSGACSGGATANNFAVNLPSGANTIAYGALMARNSTFTGGGGFTVIANTIAGTSSNASRQGVEIQNIPTAQSTTVNGTFSVAVDWAAIAVEIQ